MGFYVADRFVPTPDINTYYFPSADGVSKVRVKAWGRFSEEPGSLRGIVQIVHGMSEHVDRYDEFAAYLVDRGYAVVANDHIGHGKTAAHEDDMGHIPLKAGKEAMIADIHRLRQFVEKHCGPDVPYVMFGHSMGSFLVRTYLARHADGISAAIICGTGQQQAALSAAGNKFARVLSLAKGERFRSSILHGMGAGAYSKQIKKPRTPFDWLSVDPAVVDAYIDDPFCGAMFTVAGYAALTSLTAEMVKPACAAAVPQDMSLLFIAGEDDPVGDFGKGVSAAAQQYRDAGIASVDEILYAGMRHEILNEPGKAQVYEDIESWLSSRGL